MAKSAHASAQARRQFTVLTGPKNFISDLGEMTRLTGQVIAMAVRGPYDYWGESKEIMFQALKQCWVPMAVSCVFFGLGAPGLQGGNIYRLFGMPERLGSFFIMASVREFAPHVSDISVTWIAAPDLLDLLRRCDAVIHATGADHVRNLVGADVPCLEFRHSPDPEAIESMLAPHLERLRQSKSTTADATRRRDPRTAAAGAARGGAP